MIKVQTIHKIEYDEQGFPKYINRDDLQNFLTVASTFTMEGNNVIKLNRKGIENMVNHWDGKTNRDLGNELGVYLHVTQLQDIINLLKYVIEKCDKDNDYAYVKL